jgi:hypothetical protein
VREILPSPVFGPRTVQPVASRFCDIKKLSVLPTYFILRIFIDFGINIIFPQQTSTDVVNGDAVCFV